jgi:hypothetical protein
MEYELGKQLEIINEKLDAILVKMYPIQQKQGDNRNGSTK